MKRRLILILSSFATSAILFLSTGTDASALTACAFDDPNGYEFCADAGNNYECYAYPAQQAWCESKLPSWARTSCRAAAFGCPPQWSNGACNPDYPVWGISVICYYEDK